MWKKLALVLLTLLLIAGGVMFYLWRQVTALPEWYSEELAAGPEAAAVEVAPVKPDGKLAWKQTGKRKELRNFHKRAAKQDPVVAKVIKASRASFEDGTLEMGVVADLRNLPNDKLNPSQRELFQKVHDNFPSATDREIYIGVEDPAPVLKNGQIELGPTAKLKIGDITYDLDAAAARLGMSAASLRAQFNDEARRLGVTAP
ncbi:MAG: hypothetical protein H0T76_26095 [Nannocystis sp.]|nr:hypothetical protein [Nannocystis sp.]MBA3549965.1 hypothetical protein [Nannocystis sp.]